MVCGGGAVGGEEGVHYFKKYLGFFLIELTYRTQSTSANYATSILERGPRC
jgi:hypothetical protein